MNMVERSAILLMVLLASAIPALSGGVVKFDHEGAIINQGMLVGFTNNNVVSGTDIRVETTASLHSELEGDPPVCVADYQATIDAVDDAYFDPYFVSTKSVVGQTLIKEGQDQIDRLVTAKSYIIMPKKFDADIAAKMHFSDEGNPNAELVTEFTYDGTTYTFSESADNIEGEETLKIFLYPYCPLLKDLDLDYENVYIDSVHKSDFDYEGSLVMRAVQT